MATMTASTAALAEDVGNIQSMEHVNVTIPDQQIATLFYIVGLGFTRDPHMNVGLNNIWVNIGDNQFHLPTGKAQVLRGHTGLVVRDLAGLKQRLASVEEGLKGTAFAWSDRGETVEVTCPWGNQYRCHGPGSFGSMALGIPYVEFTVPVGSARSIKKFYEVVFGSPGALEENGHGTAAIIESGATQTLNFRESEVVPDYDGHHLAIYVANFSGPFQYLDERKLITEGVRNHQFRFQDIVDPDSGKVVFTIEHEVRSIRHPLFKRTLVNRDPVNPPMVMMGRPAPAR